MFKLSLIDTIKNIVNPEDSLKWKTIQSSILVVVGLGLKNIIRLGGNLIMTRLLFPEAFGLMLIVTLVQSGLMMLSDAGVRDAMLVKSRDREQDFLNTAWVILITRGGMLCIVTLLLAWPISIFYEQPILIGLLAISSLGPLIDGFSNPRRFLYERDIRQFELVVADLISQFLPLVVGVIILFYYPSIWVLACFSIMGMLVKCVLSYKIFKGPAPRFKLDKGIFKEIFNFGKWIFLSTVLTFLATQGDKIFVSKLLTIEQLGIFSVAIVLAKVMENIASSMAGGLLLPLYAEIANSKDGGLKGKFRKIKLGFSALLIPPIVFFCAAGDWLIELMYDDRYTDAGWMLQIMAVGTLFDVFTASIAPLMIGNGHVKAHLSLYAIRVFIYFVVLVIGAYSFGLVGIVVGIAIAPMIIYFIYSTYVLSYGVNALKYDVPIFFIFGIIVFACWYVFGWPAPLQADV